MMLLTLVPGKGKAREKFVQIFDLNNFKKAINYPNEILYRKWTTLINRNLKKFNLGPLVTNAFSFVIFRLKLNVKKGKHIYIYQSFAASNCISRAKMSNCSAIICLLSVKKAANPIGFSNGLSQSSVSWRWPEGTRALGTRLSQKV